MNYLNRKNFKLKFGIYLQGAKPSWNPSMNMLPVHDPLKNSSDLVHILDENHFSCPVHLIQHCPIDLVAAKSLIRSQTMAWLLFANLLLVYLKHFMNIKRITELWYINYQAPIFVNIFATLFQLSSIFGWSILKQIQGILPFHSWTLQCASPNDKNMPLSWFIAILMPINRKPYHLISNSYKNFSCLKVFFTVGLFKSESKKSVHLIFKFILRLFYLIVPS